MSPFKQLWDSLGRLARSHTLLSDQVRVNETRKEDEQRENRIGNIPTMIERVTEFSDSVDRKAARIN